jgi:predicted RNase H-like nuclease
MRVVGVDGIPAGWVAVALEEGRFLDMRAFRRFAEVIEASPQAAAIAVDIPIGLPGDIPGDGGMRRAADEQARKLLGKGASTVFSTPSRAHLEAVRGLGYRDAQAVWKQAGRSAPSAQSYALAAKIMEVDDFVASDERGQRVHEIHPELSFLAMNEGRPLRPAKRSWGGFTQRLRLLHRAGIDLPMVVTDLLDAQPDDVLDAAAAAWTALRIAKGIAEAIPENAPKGRHRRQIAIWA